MATKALSRFVCNGKQYLLPRSPTVAICLDGSAQEYLDSALRAKSMPNLEKILQRGSSHGLVDSVVPTFTNPNNISIVSGMTPRETGICGNYLYDESLGKEVMMNDVRYLRCNTIFATLSQTHGSYPILVVTAKDKLLKLLSHNTEKNSDFLGFSVERASSEETQSKLKTLSLFEAIHALGPPPHIYDPDNSIFCLRAGVAVLSQWIRARSFLNTPPVLYLSTTDYVQHKHAPGTLEANEFYGKIDACLGDFDRLGAVVGFTADHGMNDKVNGDGSPKIVFVEEVLSSRGMTSRVILPITDPYVLHHGALGGYATVYIQDKSLVPKCIETLRGIDGIEEVLDKPSAALKYSLPIDRIGDLVVLADVSTVLGRTPAYHDLTQVPRLRSHGSIHERKVPMVFNRILHPSYRDRLSAGTLNNFELFDVLLNGISV